LIDYYYYYYNDLLPIAMLSRQSLRV